MTLELKRVVPIQYGIIHSTSRIGTFTSQFGPMNEWMTSLLIFKLETRGISTEKLTKSSTRPVP